MKRSLQILLAAVLYTSGFAQRLQIAGEEHSPVFDITFEKSPAANSRSAQNNGAANGSFNASKNSCVSLRKTLLNFVVRSADEQPLREVPIWQLPDSDAFFFLSGMTVDADGAPNAYHPADTGLDALSNAGVPGRWNGIVTDEDGKPLVQRNGDPFPGYYISCTSLRDDTKRLTDPTRYVDASRIPYVALPREVADAAGTQLGDFAVVMNLRNRKSSFAIYADIGTLGEGSVALAENLGIRSDAREGGQSGGILYLIFPGSGNLIPRTIDEIQNGGEKLLDKWGGVKRLSSCAERQTSNLRAVEY